MDKSSEDDKSLPNLSRFKGQPWSNWIAALDKPETSNLLEELKMMPNVNAFRGQPWENFFDVLPPPPSTPPPRPRSTRVRKLTIDDIGLYGVCPLVEKFSLIRCDHCNNVVKPCAYRRHLESSHASEMDVTMLPPPPPPVPAKRPKTVNMKLNNRVTSPSPLPDSTELIMDTSSLPIPAVTSSVPAITTGSAPLKTSSSYPLKATNTSSFTPKLSNSSSFSSSKALSISSFPSSASSSTAYDSNSVAANQSRRKSPNVNVSSDRKSQKSRDKDKEKDSHHKDKDVDSDKHTSTDESKSACSKQTSCKTSSSSSSSRRSVGRTKEFTKLVAEHRAAKDLTGSVVSGKTTTLQWKTTTLQSLLKPVPTFDTKDSVVSAVSCNQSSSSQLMAQEPILLKVASPLHTSPGSPTLSLLYPVNTFTTSINAGANVRVPSPLVTASTTDYSSSSTSILTSSSSSSSSACSSPSLNPAISIMSAVPATNALPTLLPVLDMSLLTASIEAPPPPKIALKVLPKLAPKDISTKSNTPKVLHVLPHKSVFVKQPPPQLFTVNLNMNTESISTSGTPAIKVAPNPQPVVVSRNVIESLNVPVVVEMPTLPDVNNIKLYATYPKPLMVSTFNGKQTGKTVLISNHRLEYIRNQFKSVLKKSQNRVPAMSAKPASTATANQVTSVLNVKTLNNSNSTSCRFPPKSSVTMVPGMQANSILAHRPNILRTATPKPRPDRDGNVPPRS